MKIGVVHWGFPPRGGGVEAHLATVLPEIVNQGEEAFVLTETMPNVPEYSAAQGVKVFRRDELSVGKLERMPDIYQKCRRLFNEFISKNQIDVIQAHNMHMDYFDVSKALADACIQNNIPCYLVVHNHEFIDRDKETMVSILEDLPWSKIVCISRFIEKELKKKARKVPKQNWVVILHGIDLEKFNPISSAKKEKMKRKYNFSGRKVILHPARMLRWKGIVPAIKSLPKIIDKFPKAVLVLTGKTSPIHKDNDEVENYYRLVNRTIVDLGLEDYVSIRDYCYFDIVRLTQLAEVLIYTTIAEEPFGLCPVEAMACGVPVVATRSGGIIESVVDSETGYLISKDPEILIDQLAVKVSQLLSDNRLAKKLGAAGRKRAEKYFNKTRMAKDFIKLSEKLIQSIGRQK